MFINAGSFVMIKLIDFARQFRAFCPQTAHRD
jgi:hypothetical protein